VIRDLHPKRFFLETWRELDRQRDRAERFDLGPLLAFITAIVGLTLTEYWGGSQQLRQLTSWALESEGWLGDLVAAARKSKFWSLAPHAYWSLTRVLAWALLPMIVLRLSGRRARDHGLGWGKTTAHAPLYFVCVAVVLPLVFVVATQRDFSMYYPFYAHAGRSVMDLFLWELVYAGQFFAVEFLFRGFLVESGRRSLGSHAIFAMVVPYVMIHYGKPPAETFGAIVAGVVLGTLAMRSRSIWAGFFVHVTVAIAMDVAALMQKGGLPTNVWPE
jgi:membrane protease YdiL (CAAX protease family)